jgi:UbiD family decarboxylase
MVDTVSRLTDEEILRAEGDLRELIRIADAMGELEVIEGADAHLEIGALYELSLQHEIPPVLLFDHIKGYKPGYRVVGGARDSRVLNRGTDLEALEAFRGRRYDRTPLIPPREVEAGPVFENVLTGAQVDVLQFPAPKWHEHDGGPYIGTECMVIQKDPESDWVNAGTYRTQVHDENTLTVFIEPGKHGRIIRQKYWDRGEACPMVVSVGQAPVLGAVAGPGSKWGEPELAKAGGLLGRPIDVVRGKVTGLPIPADCELVFEGFVPPTEIESRVEGPFGEWPGYYGSSPRPEPVLRVEAIYFRDDPIIVGDPPAKPTFPATARGSFASGARTWDALEAAGVHGVRGVWRHLGGLILVVAIDQYETGQAKSAGLVAAGSSGAAYLGRLTIVVEDDVDITDLSEVMWALTTRWDPETQTDIVGGVRTGHIDPRLDPDRRDVLDLTGSRMIAYAVRPFHWSDSFPRVNQVDAAYAREVRDKWASVLRFLR